MHCVLLKWVCEYVDLLYQLKWHWLIHINCYLMLATNSVVCCQYILVTFIQKGILIYRYLLFYTLFQLMKQDNVIFIFISKFGLSQKLWSISSHLPSRQWMCSESVAERPCQSLVMVMRKKKTRRILSIAPYIS